MGSVLVTLFGCAYSFAGPVSSNTINCQSNLSYCILDLERRVIIRLFHVFASGFFMSTAYELYKNTAQIAG